MNLSSNKKKTSPSAVTSKHKVRSKRKQIDNLFDDGDDSFSLI